MIAPLVKGWCPGALRPMASGDGLLVRVRPRGGRLTQAEAAGIAALSAAHGNGLIDLSARANLQLRGVRADTYDALVAGLDALGLIDADPGAEARRNIVVTPFWQAGDGTTALSDALATALAAAPLALPGKFGFAIDTGTGPVLRDTSADVRIERDTDGGLIVRADGSATGVRATRETAVAIALSIACWFVASGGTRRMAAHLAAGVRLPAALSGDPVAADAVMPPAVPGLTPAGALVGLAFGQIDAATLGALAASAPLRATPWRMLLVEGAAAMPDIPGLIIAPADPMLQVVACVGAPACPQALAPTRPLATALAPHVPAGGLLHVSGCAKGCAHPQAAALTLVAQEKGFDLVHHGHAAAAPGLRGLSPARICAEPAILRQAR